VALLPVTGSAVHAQASDYPRASVGQVVRLRLNDGRRLQGRVIQTDSGPLRYHLHREGVAVADALIDSLWVRSRWTKVGAIAGGLIGGAGFATLVVAYCNAYESASGPSDGCAPAALGAFALGAAGGALLGAGIGAANTRWRLRFARSPISLRIGVDRSVGLGLALLL
jgi:hypothetical protein